MSRTVLIVDDDDVLGHSLALTIEAIPGTTAIVARNGASALRMAHDPRIQIDVLVTDLELPYMNGYELIRELRSLPRYASLPALLITASSDTGSAARASDRPDAILHKPFSYREVRRVLETLFV